MNERFDIDSLFRRLFYRPPSVLDLNRDEMKREEERRKEKKREENMKEDKRIPRIVTPMKTIHGDSIVVSCYLFLG